ncbi:urease accessory protein UreE [Sphingobium sp. BYY-5]|uniref:urease accessory protein UreE n=1 Tax=Sphingobium sp. BYY-5 TaxID=2926400 RepID=UPI001FA6C96F|nr:urease accessory protein UreE [Sphingobium sp. BYY-5]MCI4588705.1 urease accessory protein UreE [Sphingobium sp. BYY-5]
MLTAHDVLPHGHWSGPAADHITLDHDARHRRRWYYTADHGTAFLLDLARATVLQHGDALQLSDGRLVEVLAAPEVLVEVTAADPAAMIRLAWHIGNRHLPAELHPHAIRLRDDHVINAMLEGLGATVTKVQAPFTPEGGAYSGASHSHDHHHHHHDHDHEHSHAHHHHDHAG